ncbi:MAG TPA: PfkB family carbohydrate kinase [archaeon]|nr:PfkB family carbohydrate kinase [archaeon]
MYLEFSIPSGKPFDVVGVGINVIDYLFRVPRFPEPNTKMDATAVTREGGGLTATAMVACARLGLHTRYIGKFGGDEIGRMAREGLAAEGLDLKCSVHAPDAPNRLCFVLVEEGTGHRTIIRHMDSRVWLRPEDLFREAVCSGRVLHLDGYEGDAAIQAARWAREDGIPVSLDAERFTQRRDELFRLTDILIVAERFGREVTGKEDVAEILEELTRLGPSCVGITSGERGSALRYRGEIIHVPAFPVGVVDTTGAGDVFHGAFLYGVLQGWEARHILLFANAVSALKCTRLGGRTGIPCVQEVIELLRASGQGISAGAL